MAVYVDDMFKYPGKGWWCHMWSDTSDEELDALAVKIGLRKSWSHTSHLMIGRLYHYDLRKSKRDAALRNGAQYMKFRDYLKSRMTESEDA